MPTYVWHDQNEGGDTSKKGKQQRSQGRMEQRIRTDNTLKTKENTLLIVDLNNLKFENKKQLVILKELEKERERLKSDCDSLKKDELLVRRKYNEMMNDK